LAKDNETETLHKENQAKRTISKTGVVIHRPACRGSGWRSTGCMFHSKDNYAHMEGVCTLS